MLNFEYRFFLYLMTSIDMAVFVFYFIFNNIFLSLFNSIFHEFTRETVTKKSAGAGFKSRATLSSYDKRKRVHNFETVTEKWNQCGSKSGRSAIGSIKKRFYSQIDLVCKRMQGNLMLAQFN
jgi:hypothetical protein